MKIVHHFLSPLFILCFIFSGCNSQKNTVTLDPATTSNEALGRTLDAFEKRDKEALLALVSGGSEVQKFFGTVVDSFEVADSFKTKFVDVYGKEAWDAFQAAIPLDQQTPSFQITFPDFEQIRKDYSDWEATTDNGGVLEVVPSIPLTFKQLQDGWVIDGPKIFPDKKTLKGFTETQSMVSEFIESYLKAIGHEEISAEDIDYQMGKDFMILLMGGELLVDGKTSNPDRFKIDEL